MNERNKKQMNLSRLRTIYLVAAVITIILGIASRILDSGFLFFDKYLGDALYAVLIYLLLRITRPCQTTTAHAIITMGLVAAIELFQTTGIPASFRASENSLLKLVSIVLGTKFGWLDMIAYAAGVATAWLVDTMWSHKTKT